MAIGIGEPKHAIRVCGKLAPSVECLTDTTVKSHQTFGIQRGGLGQLVSPQVIAAGVRAAQKGFVPEAATGDQTMMPANFLVDTEGIVRWLYYGKHAGDHPNLDEILGVARSLTAKA